MKEELRTLLGLLNKTFSTHRKLFLQKSKAHGLYIGQPQLLEYVRQHSGCTQTEIAENLNVSSASIAFSTKRLQNNGYLMKQVDHLNMRCNKLYVTHEGEEVMDGFQVDFDNMNLELFEGFSVPELEQLASFAERVNNNMEKMLTEEHPGEKLHKNSEPPREI